MAAAVVKKKKIARVELGSNPNARVVMTEARSVVPPSGMPRWGRSRAEKNYQACLRTLATADLCDRAHSIKTGRYGLLTSAAGLGPIPVARRYPGCYMHEVVEGRVEEDRGEGRKAKGESEESPIRLSPVASLRYIERAVAIVSDETVFDETFAAQCRLAGALGAGTGKRMREGVVDWDHVRLRDICEPVRRGKWAFKEPLTRELLPARELREKVEVRASRELHSTPMSGAERKLQARGTRMLKAAGFDAVGGEISK